MNLAAGGSGTAMLTVNTTPASPASARLNLWRIGGGGGSLLAALIMFGIPSRRHRWASALMALLVIVAAGVMGCGGGESQKSAQPGTAATTAGSYTFTLTATDAANSKLTMSTNATITVQ
jgi:PKD repeat protein